MSNWGAWGKVAGKVAGIPQSWWEFIQHKKTLLCVLLQEELRDISDLIII